MLKGDFQTFVGFIVNFSARLLEAQPHVFRVELRLGFFQACDDLPLHLGTCSQALPQRSLLPEMGLNMTDFKSKLFYPYSQLSCDSIESFCLRNLRAAWPGHLGLGCKHFWLSPYFCCSLKFDIISKHEQPIPFFFLLIKLQ